MNRKPKQIVSNLVRTTKISQNYDYLILRQFKHFKIISLAAIACTLTGAFLGGVTVSLIESLIALSNRVVIQNCWRIKVNCGNITECNCKCNLAIWLLELFELVRSRTLLLITNHKPLTINY